MLWLQSHPATAYFYIYSCGSIGESRTSLKIQKNLRTSPRTLESTLDLALIMKFIVFFSLFHCLACTTASEPAHSDDLILALYSQGNTPWDLASRQDRGDLVTWYLVTANLVGMVRYVPPEY